MLLKQLLESPRSSSNLLVYDPFGEVKREELVKEVIGLANADVDGPRNILFGVNAAAMDGNGLVGIPESAMGDLKKAHRLLSALIEPVLQLAFIFDRVNGKLVGALEIDGCDFGPYFVGQDLSESLLLGQCWIREGRTLRAVERAELMGSPVATPADEPVSFVENPDVAVGFHDDPACQLLELSVPDTSDPPFAHEKSEANKTSKFRQVIKETVGTVTTQILGLGHGGQKDPASVSEMDSAADDCDEASRVLADAKNHYFFEEKALQLNLCACNNGTQSIENVSVELGFPRLPDFDVADRLYTSPFDKRSAAEVRNLGYPKVERRDTAIFVRSSIGVLAPDKPEQLFQCPVRLAIGPRMQGRKLAVLYTLRGPNKQELGKGRLKIKFGRVST
jgi:hypothetical protein